MSKSLSEQIINLTEDSSVVGKDPITHMDIIDSSHFGPSIQVSVNGKHHTFLVSKSRPGQYESASPATGTFTFNKSGKSKDVSWEHEHYSNWGNGKHTADEFVDILPFIKKMFGSKLGSTLCHSNHDDKYVVDKNGKVTKL